MKKLLALLLSLSMLLGCAACGGTATSSAGTSGDVSTPTSSEADAGPTAAELYGEAAAAADAMDNLTLDLTIDRKMTAGPDTFTEETTLSLSMQDIGTDSIKALASGQTKWTDTHKLKRYELYADGRMYGITEDLRYTAEIAQDDYLAQYPDVVLLDGAVYGSIEQDEAGIFHFSAPTALEDWVTAEDAVLIDASGTATLDDTGALAESSYNASYLLGNVRFDITVTASISGGGNELTVPESTEDYKELDHPYTPLILERAYGYAMQANSLTSTSNHTIYTEAAAVAFIYQTNADYYGGVSDLLLQMEQTAQSVDYSTGATDSYVQCERFEDGVYSISIDDGPKENNTLVTAPIALDFCREETLIFFPALSNLSDVKVTQMGGMYLLEYDYTDSYAQQLDGEISYTIFSDENFFDQYDGGYRAETASGYLGVDRYTGLPTALAVSYAGYHTIDGYDYLQSMEHTQSLFVGSTSSYKAITGELPPAQAESPSPLFYHVTGANGEEMWLLGTIHVGDPRTTNLPQEIYDAFDGADALAVEFDIESFMTQLENDPELALQVAAGYVYTDGSTLSSHIADSELYDYAVSYMKAAGNYSAGMELMKASLWSDAVDTFHLQQSYGLSSDYGVDLQLLHRAEDQGLDILDVESGIEQFEMLTGYSDEVQELLLAESLAFDQLAYGIGVSELYEHWCAGDEAALVELLREDTSGLSEEELALYEEYNNAMMVERNDKMLEVAIAYLNSGDTVFYAVGLAHLITDNGLVHTLRDAGYTVEPVEYAG